ncbi:unnamed protein product [Didymodactylos carnosus]|uniref:Uncharacterized protein n=1 Tax=Didymodactylos carnosus TaxID=1234261 RepID=A0A814AM44_9BILA|nr:unnamed protein product [Didymodactylos carnosus]CAF1118583.1 unnamed protein product [Didymodactylos carnosus]CAF3695680.1 unnamed protein product [Didymodactylos carnosus]CAF3890775.1 unnamed protein product [Didymodactylos carnosus]
MTADMIERIATTTTNRPSSSYSFPSTYCTNVTQDRFNRPMRVGIANSSAFIKFPQRSKSRNTISIVPINDKILNELESVATRQTRSCTTTPLLQTRIIPGEQKQLFLHVKQQQPLILTSNSNQPSPLHNLTINSDSKSELASIPLTNTNTADISQQIPSSSASQTRSSDEDRQEHKQQQTILPIKISLPSEQKIIPLKNPILSNPLLNHRKLPVTDPEHDTINSNNKIRSSNHSDRCSSFTKTFRLYTSSAPIQRSLSLRKYDTIEQNLRQTNWNGSNRQRQQMLSTQQTTFGNSQPKSTIVNKDLGISNITQNKYNSSSSNINGDEKSLSSTFLEKTKYDYISRWLQDVRTALQQQQTNPKPMKQQKEKRK